MNSYIVRSRIDCPAGPPSASHSAVPRSARPTSERPAAAPAGAVILN